MRKLFADDCARKRVAENSSLSLSRQAAVSGPASFGYKSCGSALYQGGVASSNVASNHLKLCAIVHWHNLLSVIVSL